ncbi:TylF/MycF family methyltransferase [Frankia sp. Cas3]|uniref:TylF/MycF family methyltransferase n=1 Tax=Frankia sp. Cas3 TaxID=3073926 RepID=UPI002AD3F411|nr:TylF/MycF family methyltransferase [Frankia sp. Cas3]
MDQADNIRELYIGLLKQTVTFDLWDAADGNLWNPRRTSYRIVERILDRWHLKIFQIPPSDWRENGRGWPRFAHTMIGAKRIENLDVCMRTVLREKVPGDFIETGVWRGGACIFMRGLLRAYGVSDRTVWVADSFQGLPPPEADKYPADAGDQLHTMSELAVSLEEVQENFRRYGLLDDQVRFLRGWFKDTLPSAPIEKLAIIRLDGDMYSSTMDGLQSLYPRLSMGGFVIVDDYGAMESCRRAVEDFRDARGIDAPLMKIDRDGVYWRNGVPVPA